MNDDKEGNARTRRVILREIREKLMEYGEAYRCNVCIDSED